MRCSKHLKFRDKKDRGGKAGAGVISCLIQRDVLRSQMYVASRKRVEVEERIRKKIQRSTLCADVMYSCMNNRIKKDFFSPILLRYRPNSRKKGSKYSSSSSPKKKSLIFFKTVQSEKIVNRRKRFIDRVRSNELLNFTFL